MSDSEKASSMCTSPSVRHCSTRAVDGKIGGLSTAMLWKRLRLTLDMIKFEHSVFALPFALTGALLAFCDSGYRAGEIGGMLAWFVVAMVDAPIDGRHPRTKMRQVPAGMLSRGFGWGFGAVAAALFFVAAGALNPLCLWLGPAGLGIGFFFFFTKRF